MGCVKKVDTVNRFSVLLLIAGLLQAPSLLAAPASLGVITFAEKPLRLIRTTVLYSASSGTRLQSGDLLESDQSITQIEGLATSTVALGPNTRVAIDRSSGVTTLHVLQGWLKVQPAPGRTGDNLDINTRSLHLDVSRSASVTHVSDNLVEVFVENGTQPLAELDKRGQAGRKTTLTHEQYSQRKGDEPLQPAGRPPATFISAMPNAFFDPLVLLSGKPAANVQPKKIRDVDFEDIAHWLRAPGLNRGALATRFSPRLATPTFRKAIIREMGGSFEWETELFRFESRGRAVKKTLSALPSYLPQSLGA